MLEALTPLELRTLEGIADGLTQRQVAFAQNRTYASVVSALREARRKLGQSGKGPATLPQAAIIFDRARRNN